MGSVAINLIWRQTQLGLLEVPIKRSYNSDVDDILNEFYIPVLNECVQYDRVSGFFSSTCLAVAAKGIARFIRNGGRMRLVTSAILQHSDIEAITNGSVQIPEIIEINLSSTLNELENEIATNHLRAMGWMIREGLLEIKVAVMVGDDGLPIDIDEVKRRGMVHQKVGIFKDLEGNYLAFDGSINETASAWNLNLEQFKVFRKWISGEREFFDDDVEIFETLWEDRANRARVFSVPEAISKKLVKLAPSNIDELDLETKGPTQRVLLGGGSQLILWNHQVEAISKWVEAGGKGILSMATGTGKTIAALGCMIKTRDSKEKFLTVISCPQLHLVSQWENVIEGLGIETDAIICDSSNSKWKKQMSNALVNLDLGITNHLTIITTHDTLASESFRNRIQQTDSDILLIVDEVHGAGTEIRNEGLLEKYEYRLGLSATPERPLDPEGTLRINSYFKNVVYEFSIGDAINTVNPRTGKTFLVPYDYFPVLVELTDDEFNEYRKISKKIGKAYHAAKSDRSRREYFENLCFERARVVNRAENKLFALKKILDELLTVGPIQYTVVYCEQPMCSKVNETLLNHHIRVRNFTQNEGTRKEEAYGGISEREYILEGFSKGTPQVLTAIKCLDEGVDVPVMRIAIVMASSQNPRQSIQRRGRVLRNAPRKEKASIFDMIVIPPVAAEPEKLAAIEKKVLERELTRCDYYAADAANQSHIEKTLEDLRNMME